VNLDKEFEATLQKSPEEGGWTYVVTAPTSCP